MTDPLKTEHAMDGLRVKLMQPDLAILKLFHCVRFLERFILPLSQSNMARPYLLEMSELLHTFSSDIDPMGCNPLLLARAHEVLSEASDRLATSDDHSRISESANQVLVAALQGAAMIGNFNFVAHRLQVDIPETIPDTPSARAALFVSLIQLARPGLVGAARDVSLKSRTPSKQQATLGTFPVVILSPQDVQSDVPGALLRTVHIDILRTGDEGDDLSLLSRAIHGTVSTENAVLAGRHILKNLNPGTLSTGYKGQFVFSHPEINSLGNSANLLISALFVCGVQKFRELRHQYFLQPEVAITGDVDSTGQILSVSDDSISQKAEACFFPLFLSL